MNEELIKELRNRAMETGASEYAELMERAADALESKQFAVMTPAGYLCAVAKGTDDEYPGLYVSLSPSPDGFNVDQMVACVEYDSSEEVIKTECYMAEAEQPAYIIRHDNGEDIV